MFQVRFYYCLAKRIFNFISNHQFHNHIEYPQQQLLFHGKRIVDICEKFSFACCVLRSNFIWIDALSILVLEVRNAISANIDIQWVHQEQICSGTFVQNACCNICSNFHDRCIASLDFPSNSCISRIFMNINQIYKGISSVILTKDKWNPKYH